MGHLEELGFANTEPAAAVSSLTAQMSAAIRSGQMRTNLVLSGSKLHSVTLSSVWVVGYVDKNNTVDITPLITYAPTTSPSAAPPLPFLILGLESTGLMAVFIPIFALIFLALLLAWCCRHRAIQASRKAHTIAAFHFDDDSDDDDDDDGDDGGDEDEDDNEDDDHDGEGADTSDEDFVIIDDDNDSSDDGKVNSEQNAFPQLNAQTRAGSPYHDQPPAAIRHTRSLPAREFPAYQSMRSKSARFRFEAKDEDEDDEEKGVLTML
jgi:hypothetical protein